MMHRWIAPLLFAVSAWRACVPGGSFADDRQNAAVLVSWIVSHSAYTRPDGPMPGIVFEPAEEIQQEACGGPCIALAFYLDAAEVIHLDDRMMVESNVCATSVLLHERVHWLQDRDRRFLNLPHMVRAAEREHEAYALQRLWLVEHGHRMEIREDYALGAFTGPGC